MFALHLLAWFAGAVFLTNVLPHFISGVQGRSFQSPFSKPPGIGLSSPRSNIVWGFINLVVGWLLLTQVGEFDIRAIPDAAAFGAGVLAMGLYVAGYFGQFHADKE